MSPKQVTAAIKVILPLEADQSSISLQSCAFEFEVAHFFHGQKSEQWFIKGIVLDFTFFLYSYSLII